MLNIPQYVELSCINLNLWYFLHLSDSLSQFPNNNPISTVSWWHGKEGFLKKALFIWKYNNSLKSSQFILLIKETLVGTFRCNGLVLRITAKSELASSWMQLSSVMRCKINITCKIICCRVFRCLLAMNNTASRSSNEKAFVWHNWKSRVEKAKLKRKVDKRK